MKRGVQHENFIKAKTILIKEKNWTKGAFHEGIAFCLLGALRRAATGNAYEKSEDKQLLPPIEKCIKKHFPTRHSNYWPTSPIIFFNDDAATKHADILTVLDCAIAETAPK